MRPRKLLREANRLRAEANRFTDPTGANPGLRSTDNDYNGNSAPDNTLGPQTVTRSRANNINPRKNITNKYRRKGGILR